MVKSKNFRRCEGEGKYLSTSPKYKNKIILGIKPRGLYSKFLIRLKEAEQDIPNLSKKDYIPYPKVFEKVCRGFSITKEEAVEIIFLLREFEFLDVVKYKGLHLNYDIQNLEEVNRNIK